jgi:hypothetical protein
MKKFAVPVALMAVAVAAWVLWSKRGPALHGLDPAALVPASTVALLEMPDPQASGERWKLTALGRIGAEPEMQAFLERPRSQLQLPGQLSGALPKIWALKPRGLFAAILSVEGTRPRWLAGFEFKGSKADIDAAVSEARAAVVQRRPAGRADIVRHGTVTIETFTDDRFALCSAVAGNVYLVGNSIEDLKFALDRLARAGDAAGQTLADSPARTRALAHLPAGAEARTFLQPRAVVDRLLPLASAAGAKLDETQAGELRKVEVIAASTAFEGGNLRDTVFIGRAADGTKPVPLKQPLRAYASAASLFLLAIAVDWPESFEIPAETADPTGVLEWLRRTLPRMAAKGVGIDKLGDAFGSEAGLLIEWPTSDLQPSLLGSVEVQDPALAAGIFDELLGNPASGLVVRREQVGEARIYAISTGGRPGLTPSVALTPQRLLFSLDATRLKAVAAAPLPSAGMLEQNESFKQALGTAGDPDRAFAYLDLRGLFERAYGFGRPFLVFGAGLMPGVARYIDASKLPVTETVAQHLGPVVFSHRTLPDGALIESTGPVTLNQVVIGGMVVGGVSAARGYIGR